MDIRIAYNRDGISKGFAYVEFKYLEDAADAHDNLNNSELDGRALKLDFDLDRTEKKRNSKPFRQDRE